MEDTFSSWPESEKYRFLGEILDAKLWELFVTPKEIDEAVKRISYTISRIVLFSEVQIALTVLRMFFSTQDQLVS